MAATTITPMTWTDDTGTFAAPNNDGTPINNAQLQLLLGNINALFTSPFTFGSTVSSEGFGTHTLSAGGTGPNTLKVRNSTAGTSNAGLIQVQNDGGDVANIYATASTWTASPDLPASCMGLRGMASGGISISAQHASGDVRIYSRAGGTAVATFGTMFTTTLNTSIANTQPTFVLNETDGGADAKKWQLFSNSNALILCTVTDADAFGASAIQIARSGTTVSTMELGGDVLPLADNSKKCGSSSRRWSEMWAVSWNTGDLNFENGFTFTEHYRVGIALPGIALVNPVGDVVAFFDERGSMHCDHVWHDLGELGWQRTTPAERLAIEAPVN